MPKGVRGGRRHESVAYVSTVAGRAGLPSSEGGPVLSEVLPAGPPSPAYRLRKMGDVSDRLEVKVVAARGLGEVEGGDCNPFALVRCGAEEERTAVASATSAPEWNASTMIFTDVADAADDVVVAVMHKALSAARDQALGRAVISLRTCFQAVGVEQDDWFPLEDADGRACGEVRLELAYFVDADDDFPEDDSDDEAAGGGEPNMVRGTICRARGLRHPDRAGPVDAYCTVRVGRHKASTATVRRSNGPLFDHAFELPCGDGAACVRVKVKARAAFGSTLIGEAVLPMVEVAAHGEPGCSRWCRLEGKDGEVGKERGAVELQIAWVRDRKYARSLARLGASLGDLAGGLWGPGLGARTEGAEDRDEGPKEDWLLEEDAFAPQHLTSREQEELDERRSAGAMMAGRVVDELEGRRAAAMKPGDYAVQVHVIECRDLKAEDLNGLSDPYARVRVHGRQRKTRVVKKVTSCVFDDVLHFSLPNLTTAAAEAAAVDIAILDHDAIGRHATIGSASFDLRKVHALADHEFYRKWVGLVDTTNSADNGYQGFLKCSVTVLGPGDEQRAHDLDAEYQRELEREEEEGRGIALSGPTLPPARLTFLVVYCWEAEDLPATKRNLLASNLLKCYVVAEAGGASCRTQTRRCRADPKFGEELWFPVTEPVEFRRVAVGLADYVWGGRDRTVAYLYLDVDDVPRSDRAVKTSLFGTTYQGPRPRWHNLYGAPRGVQGRRGAPQNRYGAGASTYRGRVLLSLEVLTRPPRREATVPHRKAFAFRPTPGLKPATAPYHLRALALMGSELPVVRAPGRPRPLKLGLTVAIGNHVLEYAAAANARGVVEWNELLTLKGVHLPVLLEELPDVVACVVAGRRHVGFCRIPAAALLKEQMRGAPTWHRLTAEAARGGLGDENPGALLLQLGLGLSEDANDPHFRWDDLGLLEKFADKRPCCVRVYVYQARNLPPATAEGLLDPYVKVRFCGRKEKTRAHAHTTNPLFYETLDLHALVPRDARYGPDVVLQVWNRRAVGRRNAAICSLRLPLGDLPELAHDTARAPDPRWHGCVDASGRALATELLCCAARIRKRDAKEKFSKPPSIAPLNRMAWVEVTVVGVRRLRSAYGSSPRRPWLRFDVPAPDDKGDGGGTFRTPASAQPSGRDANFLVRRVLQVELPEDPELAPRLDIRCFDSSRVGAAPLLGSCAVDLRPKLPWNPVDYVAPQSELFDDAQARALAEQREREERAKAAKADEDDASDEDAEPGNVGVSFGAGDGDNDDLSSSDGESVVHRELEVRGDAGRDDGGTGAFGQDMLDSLPPVLEDARYREELALREEAILHEQGEERRGLLETLGARLAAAADVGEAPGEPQYALKDLDIDFPSQWAAADFVDGREWWLHQESGELEKYLHTRPFETYTLYRGRRHPNPAKSTLREVGHVKAVIRVLDEDPQFSEPLFPLSVLRVGTYAVRVYVIRAANVEPQDGPTADPYVRIKLGDDVQTGAVRRSTLKPDFYECFEFSTRLPGPAQVKVQLRDHSRWRPAHAVLGESRLDLEDRWFHRKWQALDERSEANPGNPLKPIEVRRLTRDGSLVARGQLYAWVEIRKDAAARRDPPVALEGPERREFEVRVVVWASKDVPFEMGDYYVQAQVGNSRPQKTDVHWRCRNGKASWNWRLKIGVELPLASPDLGRLSVQLWDQDVVKWNDIVGEATVDLYRWLLKAYHENRAVNVFREVNEAVARKKAEEQGLATAEDLAESDGSSDDDDDDDDDGGDGDDGDEGGGGDGEETKEAPPGDEATNPLLAAEKKKEEKAKEKEGAAGPPVADADSNQEAAFFVKQLKEFVGLGDIDDTAQWVAMTYNDVRRRRVSRRGAVALSVEILPPEEAEDRPAGQGRSEPNANPFLPPTTGRMSLSYNPLAIVSALLGPRLAFQLLCCLCCVLLLVVMGILGMYFTSFYTLWQSLS